MMGIGVSHITFTSMAIPLSDPLLYVVLLDAEIQCTNMLRVDLQQISTTLRIQCLLRIYPFGLDVLVYDINSGGSSLV